MRTVKEISDLTGISVRTLHYYDEIGLLKPTEKSDAGYRLYDDKALETLQQILFFREFDISLKEIKAVLDNPALERNQILQVQRKMLVTKKERMERLIASIDDILKGENKMDFTIFTKTEVEEMFQTMLEHMPENMRNIAIKEFGSIEQWKKHYMEVVSSEEMQKGYAKVVEWYGGKDKFLSVARTPVSKEVAESYNKRIEAILQKLIAKQNCDIDSFEVKELVGEYGFVMKQFSQIKEEKGFMMAQVPVSALFLVLCGLCTSVMWGGIFNLAVEGLGKYTAQASGIFMMMVVGGGVLPLIQQSISDSVGYMASYWLIIAALAYLLFYGLVGCKNVNKDIPVE